MADQEAEDARATLARQAERAREVEHRVKNTLQLISSIVLLQGRRAEDDAARKALRAVHQRVAAVSVAHRHVSWSQEAEQVEAAGLIREIVGDLAGSAGRDDVAIRLDLEPLRVPGRQGAPIALLVSEAVSNALRHAFPQGQGGEIRIGLRRTAEGLELTIADNGVGMPAGGLQAGFGFTVMQLMAQQLRGRLITDSTQPGVRLSVTVPMPTDAPPPS